MEDFFQSNLLTTPKVSHNLMLWPKNCFWYFIAGFPEGVFA